MQNQNVDAGFLGIQMPSKASAVTALFFKTCNTRFYLFLFFIIYLFIYLLLLLSSSLL